jgi:transposase
VRLRKTHAAAGVSAALRRSMGYALMRQQLTRLRDRSVPVRALILNHSCMSHAVSSVGIDVSKATVEVALLATDHTTITRSFPNTLIGLTGLLSWCKEHSVAAATPCVIESTGDLHLLSAVTLTKAGHTVNVINPLITKQYQRASVRDAKTDRIDAARLAWIGQNNPALPVFSADLATLGAKKLLSLIALLERLKQQLAASLRQFCVTQELLGLPIDGQAVTQLRKDLEVQIAALYCQLQHLTPEPVRHLAATTPGLSVRNAAVVAAVTAGATFTHRDQLVAYVGLDVRKRESGQWHGKEKLSKRGNAFVRKILFQIAWGLKQHHPVYQAYYRRLRDRGKHYVTCLLAVARKFLRCFFAVYLQPMPG